MGSVPAGEGAQTEFGDRPEFVGVGDLLGEADGHDAPAGGAGRIDVVDLEGHDGAGEGGPELRPVPGEEDDVVGEDVAAS